MVSVVSIGLTLIAQTNPPQPSNGVGARIGTARPLPPDTIKEVPTDLPWTRVSNKDGFTGEAARRALRGTAERLAKPGCQVIVSEFQDERGQPLSDRLVELGSSPEDYLRLVIFHDAGGSPQCGSAPPIGVSAAELPLGRTSGTFTLPAFTRRATVARSPSFTAL